MKFTQITEELHDLLAEGECQTVIKAELRFQSLPKQPADFLSLLHVLGIAFLVFVPLLSSRRE